MIETHKLEQLTTKLLQNLTQVPLAVLFAHETCVKRERTDCFEDLLPADIGLSEYFFRMLANYDFKLTNHSLEKFNAGQTGSLCSPVSR